MAEIEKTGIEPEEQHEPETADHAEEKDAPELKYSDEDLNRIIAQKIAAERRKLSKLLQSEQEESDLQKRERNVIRRERMADIRDQLVSEGLPQDIAKLIDYSSEESTKESYKTAARIFREMAQKEAIGRIYKGNPYGGGRHEKASTDDSIERAFTATPPRLR